MTEPLIERLEGRIALVAGASGGIGSAVASGFRDAGATVLGVDCSAGEATGYIADTAAGDAGSGGADTGRGFGSKSGEGRARVIACDVTDEAAVADLAARVRREHGRLDFLVNAAGIARTGTVAETSLADFRAVLEANLTSCFLLARQFYPLLAESRGAVVLCGSSNGVNGGSRLSGPAYAVAKAGIHNFVRYLAKEWAADGIRVNAVAPGPIDTALIQRFDAETREALRRTIPLGRDGTPAEVAANILFLCSRHAAWQTGSIVNISGGLVLG